MTKDFRTDVKFDNNLTASAGTTTLGVTNVVGAMTANTASISGSVTFTAGTLGPFIVSSGSLTSSSGVITASTASFTGNVYLPSTASLSGSVIATQAWVSSQGYSTGGSSASTGTGSVVYNTSPTFLGTITASTASFTGKVYLPATSSAGGYQIFAGNNDANFLALGASVLQNWYNGNANTYSIGIGYQALSQITAGNGGDNLAIGTKALGSASTYSTANSTAIGNYALYNQTNGTNVESSYSTAVGWRAMGLASGTLSNNTALGAIAMQSSSTSNNNTAIGYNSLTNLTTGSRNTALGSSAGRVTTTGSYNLSLGYNISPPTASTNGVVLIGNDSGGVAAAATADNQIVLGTVNHSTIIPGAASVGGNRVTTNDIIRGQNHVPAGSIDIASRLFITGSLLLTASAAYYQFFTPLENATVSSFIVFTNSAVTGVLRFGLYTVTNGDLTSASLSLVARSASTSVTTTNNGLTTKTFDTTGGYPSSYTLIAGTRYAIGWISYAAPGFYGNSNVTSGLLGGVVPYVSKIVTAQSDITLAASASSMANSGQYFWIRLS